MENPDVREVLYGRAFLRRSLVVASLLLLATAIAGYYWLHSGSVVDRVVPRDHTIRLLQDSSPAIILSRDKVKLSKTYGFHGWQADEQVLESTIQVAQWNMDSNVPTLKTITSIKPMGQIFGILSTFDHQPGIILEHRNIITGKSELTAWDVLGESRCIARTAVDSRISFSRNGAFILVRQSSSINVLRAPQMNIVADSDAIPALGRVFQGDPDIWRCFLTDDGKYAARVRGSGQTIEIQVVDIQGGTASTKKVSLLSDMIPEILDCNSMDGKLTFVAAFEAIDAKSSRYFLLDENAERTTEIPLSNDPFQSMGVDYRPWDVTRQRFVLARSHEGGQSLGLQVVNLQGKSSRRTLLLPDLSAVTIAPH